MIYFVFEPIQTAIKAAQNVFPDLKAEIQFNPELGIAGVTTFPSDGSTPLIDINAGLPFYAAVEQIMHELAHVAVRTDEEHIDAWHRAHDAIKVEYQKLMNQEIDSYLEKTDKKS